MIDLLTKFTQLYLFPPNKLHIVGLIWFIGLFLYTLNKLSVDLDKINLKSLLRLSCISLFIVYFIQIFYDIWAFALVYLFDNASKSILNEVFIVRVSRDAVQLAIMFLILSSPSISGDFPTLREIRVLRNWKLHVLNIVAIVLHILYLKSGILSLSYTEWQPIHFFVGYLTMRVLTGLIFFSLWDSRDKKRKRQGINDFDTKESYSI